MKGHIDPPEGLFEAIAEKLEDCHKGKWARETGKSTGEFGMDLDILTTNLWSSELSKLTANAFLAQ